MSANLLYSYGWRSKQHFNVKNRSGKFKIKKLSNINNFQTFIFKVVYRTIHPAFSRRSGVQQLLHFIQSAASGKFRPFDYGPNENFRIYRATEPPDYPLENISSPVYLYVGEKDRVFMKKVSQSQAVSFKHAIYNKI